MSPDGRRRLVHLLRRQANAASVEEVELIGAEIAGLLGLPPEELDFKSPDEIREQLIRTTENLAARADECGDAAVIQAADFVLRVLSRPALEEAAIRYWAEELSRPVRGVLDGRCPPEPSNPYCDFCSKPLPQGRYVHVQFWGPEPPGLVEFVYCNHQCMTADQDFVETQV